MEPNMTDSFANTKKKNPNRFGVPPTSKEASQNLSQPEYAPALPETKSNTEKEPRTVPISAKLTKTMMKEIKQIALDRDMKIFEVIEASFEAYKREIEQEDR